MLLLQDMLQDIKLGRLVMAIAVTVLIADTLPHPNLSTGLLESSVTHIRSLVAEMQNQSRTMVANSPDL